MEESRHTHYDLDAVHTLCSTDAQKKGSIAAHFQHIVKINGSKFSGHPKHKWRSMHSSGPLPSRPMLFAFARLMPPDNRRQDWQPRAPLFGTNPELTAKWREETPTLIALQQAAANAKRKTKPKPHHVLPTSSQTELARGPEVKRTIVSQIQRPAQGQPKAQKATPLGRNGMRGGLC